MTKIAFLFGGQGTELPRMGLDIAERVPDAAALLDAASEVTGVDVRDVLALAGPELRRTSMIQPLLVAVGLGAHAALAKVGIAPAVVAGHSLGELTAWAAAGALTARDAIALAAVRGRAMEREATRHPGGMIAVAGDARTIAQLVASAPAIALAAHNAPEEWTLSGDDRGLAAVAARCAATRLPVAGAWHSPAMAGAVADFAAALADAAIAREACEVVANRDGARATSATLRELLAGQLVRPVQWAKTMQTLASAGVTHYIVLGPSKLVRGLVYKNVGRAVRVVVVESYDDIARAVAELAS